MKNATIYRPSGRNRTCGPVIPVQCSNQLMYRVDLDSYHKCIKFTLEISIYKITPSPPPSTTLFFRIYFAILSTLRRNWGDYHKTRLKCMKISSGRPSSLPPPQTHLGVATPLSPTLTEAPLSLIKI